MHESAPLFREEQRFSQPWLWAIVVVAAVAAWIGLAAVVLDSDDGAGWPVAIVLLFVAVGLPLLFALGRLTVEVLADRVEIRYRPFITAPSASMRSWPPSPSRTARCGSTAGGASRLVAAQDRLQRARRSRCAAHPADGRTVLIGSQRADELAAAIRDRLPSSGP